MVDNHDGVRIADGAEPMRDHERRTTPRQIVQRCLHLGFVLIVERARRLVEQQQRRVAHERPRQRDALLLPAGEGGAGSADPRLEAARQRRDEVERVCLAGRLLDGVHRAVGKPVRDVVADGDVGEERGLLLHPRGPATQVRLAHPGHVGAVEQDAAGRRHVEAEREREERRLSRAGAAQDGGAAAGRHAEGEGAEDGAAQPRGVGKVDVDELERPARRARGARGEGEGRRRRCRGVGVGGLRGGLRRGGVREVERARLEVVEDLRRRAERLLDAAPLVEHVARRVRDKGDVEDEGGERLAGQHARRHKRGAASEYGHVEGGVDGAVEDARAAVDGAVLGLQPQQAVQLLPVPPPLAPLAAVRPDELDERETLLRHARRSCEPVLLRLGESASCHRVEVCEERPQQHARDDEQRQAAAQPQHDRHAREGLQHLPQHDVDVEREHVSQLDAVSGEARRQVARALLVVERLRLSEQRVEERRTQPRHQPCAAHPEAKAADAGEHGCAKPDRGEADEGGPQLGERARGVRAEPQRRVERCALQGRQQSVARRGDGEAHERRHERSGVGLAQGEEGLPWCLDLLCGRR
mmetsp:Transcript_27544/g.91627  ORF Transcript_27544/g.91627 Transcript_27544/m.91627 type:complete len:584 (+) Transcript_27544:524-2275(+)